MRCGRLFAGTTVEERSLLVRHKTLRLYAVSWSASTHRLLVGERVIIMAAENKRLRGFGSRVEVNSPLSLVPDAHRLRLLLAAEHSDQPPQDPTPQVRLAVCRC